MTRMQLLFSVLQGTLLSRWCLPPSANRDRRTQTNMHATEHVEQIASQTRSHTSQAEAEPPEQEDQTVTIQDDTQRELKLNETGQLTLGTATTKIQQKIAKAITKSLGPSCACSGSRTT